MQPLIDADVLHHELGWSGQPKDPDSGEEVLLSFERVSELLDEKIALICDEVDATEEPILFMTSSPKIVEMYNRWGHNLTHKDGFRYDVAKTQTYKGNRKNPKPYHFYNIVAYLMAEYDVRVSIEGLEADDMMVIEQLSRPSLDETVICSRDKDLRICEGWHYSWECGGQRSLGPHFTGRVGHLELIEKKKTSPTTGKTKTEKKVVGYGQKFFYYQMLVGDTADYIPGLKGWGLVGAYKLLSDIDNEYDLYKAVQAQYKEVMGEQAKEYFFEQANLLWMREEVSVGYAPPKKEKK